MTTTRRRGQPEIQDWEKVRTVAWANWVRHRTQQKADEYAGIANPSNDDPFVSTGTLDLLNERLGKSKRTRTIALSDLNNIFQGNKSNSNATLPAFSAYRLGRHVRLSSDLIESIDKVLSGTASFYTLGPYKTPLWAALAGKITAVDFWKPMTDSAVFDSAELDKYSASFDLLGYKGNKHRAFADVPWEIWVQLLHKLPLPPMNEITKGNQHPLLSGSEDKDRAAGDVWYGYGVLAIGLCQVAVNDTQNADPYSRQDLCTLMLRLDPLWARLDALHSLLNDDSPNAHPIGNAVNLLTEKLRQSILSEDEQDAATAAG